METHFITNMQPPSNHTRSTKLLYLCVSFIAALLCGCISGEGDVRSASLTKVEPFQSMVGKRVTLLRPIHIRERLPYASDPFSSDKSADDVAWISGVSGISGASKKWENNDDVRNRLAGRTLPAGTVIQIKHFWFVRAYNIAWLPGQGLGIPWYPGRGLSPEPTSFYVQFTSEPTSAIGRPFGAEVALGYRWGHGSHLWAAPWEPKGKAPVFVGNLGSSFKP